MGGVCNPSFFPDSVSIPPLLFSFRLSAGPTTFSDSRADTKMPQKGPKNVEGKTVGRIVVRFDASLPFSHLFALFALFFLSSPFALYSWYLRRRFERGPFQNVIIPFSNFPPSSPFLAQESKVQIIFENAGVHQKFTWLI